MVDSGEHRWDAFLSYARADDPDFRRALSDGLARAGCRVWLDREAMPNRGTTFGQEIRRAIEACDRLVLLVGPGALSSEYVAQEWQYADDIGKPVVPIVRSTAFHDLPERLRHYHGVDARQLAVDTVVADLARLLDEPVRPLGPCFHLPRQPPHARDRVELTDHLSRTLLPDQMRPQDAGRAPRAAVLYGVPGSGKSTVAAAFAAATRTRRVFSDGIVWLTGGPEFQPLAAARELLRLAAPGARLPETETEIDVRLAAALGDRELLIVLDDVRDPDSALPFVNALGAGARLLLTTLDQAVATALGAVRIAVGRFHEAAARELLADWAGGGPLPADAEVVLQACDGLPFALAIVGAMIANRTPWADVAQALDARRLDELTGRFPGYPHRTVLGVLAASFEALTADDPRAAECYLELAGFQPGAVLTRAVLVRLWSRPGRLAPLEAKLVLPVLERRLLLQGLPDGNGFRLHGLHEDFVRIRHPDPTNLSKALVTSYRDDKGVAGWAELADDGYVFDHLVGHLAALDDRSTLFEVVTRQWIQRQWGRRGDLGQALDDARRAIDVAVQPPVDLVNIARLSVLAGQITATLREASPGLIGALAEVGDVDRALRWAGDHPDAPERFAALLEVARALLDNGALTMARRVCRVAAETIPGLGGRVESGSLPGLAGLNAVHALVHFPHPEEWEGTEDALIAVARLPLDALVWLAPLASQAGAVADLVTVTNPSWELYGHLLPLVAVEELAQRGEPTVARELLDAYPEPPGGEGIDDDLVNAARYRYAVAMAAVGDFDEARILTDSLSHHYEPVGRRGLARNLARAGRIDEAVGLLDSIDDETVADQALVDIFDAALDRGVPDECRRLAAVAEACGRPDAADMLSAMSGDPEAGRRFLEADDTALALAVGVGVAGIHWDRGAHGSAVEMVRALVGIAEEVLGPQWWAPGLVEVEQELAHAAAALASLLVRSGEPMPEDFDAVTPGVEHLWGSTPAFKLTFIRDLAASGRFAEALELTDLPSVPGGRAMGLANALAATESPATDPDLADRVRDAARELAAELNGIAVGSRALDEALSAVLFSHGLDGPVAPLVEALGARTDLPLTLGARAGLLAEAGRSEDVRRLARQVLERRALAVPEARARAMVLTAVAARRSGFSTELAAVRSLLADLREAAGALDVLAEVIDLYGTHVSLDAAARIARSVPSGPEADLADTSLSSDRLEYPMEISDRNIAAAAAARATSAAAMALVMARAGEETEARTWLRTCERFLEAADWVSPSSRAADAVARYLWAARCALDPTTGPEAAGPAALVAWYLWDRGHRPAAVRCAREFLDRLRHPLDLSPHEPGDPVFHYAEDFLRDMEMYRAGRTSLVALLATAAAADGDSRRAEELAKDVDLLEMKALPSLTFAEGAEYRAAVAIGLNAAGRSDAAMELLRYAASESLTMARRGELTPFERLCQALVELLPAGDAHAVWAYWLQAAAQSGAYPALGMIAAYLRRLPAETLQDIVVNTETGDLGTVRPPAVSSTGPAAPA
ncbi:toll/interleukin-1 receptor domain-containing protein [Streptomyces sp. V4I2]|uniref:toll/interleukin-1 receptor domain-containing protein n=1 Tax=Streptomyces sp. V4I2 TaxID=3042280 RepID=UPI002780F78C|nr:toll/interleukin-1 receptor domain-containing protein [Streptomyces sp. V4I2]MDQ1042978.1 hypothetical protein [Streptomyces sp. V4I2]